jgi:caffeoyl-CoA O-methyltransferase
MRTKWMLVVLVAAVSALVWGQRGGGFRGGPRGRGMEAVPTQAKSEAEKRVLATLAEAQQIGETYLNVPVNDGRVLRVLAESVDAKNIVELGTSTGLSGMWFGLALMKTGGKLTTFELDPGRAALARTHFKKAGVDAFITVVEGDAHQNVTRLKDPIDVVFLDADKEGYLDYLNKLLPLVRPGGLILAHNVDTAADYVQAVTTNPDLETVFAGEGQGLGITLKKR